MLDEKLRTSFGKSFGKLSRTYDEVRPDYPEELVRDVIEISGVPSDGKILEIGIGTGKATRSFAEKDYEITALDISEEQMAIHACSDKRLTSQLLTLFI
jgi:ubiquinone/menaquinone biosynthesis C-methylase UbiE